MDDFRTIPEMLVLQFVGCFSWQHILSLSDKLASYSCQCKIGGSFVGVCASDSKCLSKACQLW